MKKLLGFLLGILFAFGAVAFAGEPLAALPIGPLPEAQMGVKATASTPHSIVFTFTASTSTYTGLGYNFYFGTASGGESGTPVNSSLLTSICTSGSCTATFYATGGTGGQGTSSLIVPLNTVYATVEACVPSSSGTVCSVASNEVSCLIPLASSDIGAPTSLAGVAH